MTSTILIRKEKEIVADADSNAENIRSRSSSISDISDSDATATSERLKNCHIDIDTQLDTLLAKHTPTSGAFSKEDLYEYQHKVKQIEVQLDDMNSATVKFATAAEAEAYELRMKILQEKLQRLKLLDVSSESGVQSEGAEIIY